MAIANKYLSKVNDSANPQWITFDEIKKAFMKGRTIIIVEGDASSMVCGIYSSEVQTITGTFLVGGVPES